MSHSETSSGSALLAMYQRLLEYIRENASKSKEMESLIGDAEVVLEQALKEEKLVPAQRKSPYFGYLGKNYDFQLEVTRVSRRKYGFRLECLDKLGRLYIVRAPESSVKFALLPGMNLFFRGQVQSKRSTKASKATILDALSELQKITSTRSLAKRAVKAPTRP